MSLTFNTPHESRVNTLPFTAHKEKDYPIFFIYTPSKIKLKSILNRMPLKLSILQFNQLFLYLLKLLISKLYSLLLLTHSLLHVSILPLIFNRSIKIIKPNLIVVLLLFKISFFILPFSPQDTSDTSKSPQLIINLSTTMLML